jgi:peptidoglycan/xylan/chitin deacetylase (PgdA/CDA1 family)
MNFPEMDLDLKKLLKGGYEAERLPKDFSPERIVPDFAFNVLNPRGLLYRPVVNEDYLKNGGQKPTWPDGKQFAVCLTHDVDTVSSYSLRQSFRAIQKQLLHSGSAFQKVKAFLRAGIDLARIGGQKDPLHFYERWLGMEKEFGSHSTFFFWPGWGSVTKHHLTDLPYELFDSVVFDNQRCTVAEMIREIDRQGWEIGLHPSWYSFDDADELKRQKESLEQALDNEVISVRQHYLHYDIRVTPAVQAEAGFKYDSTLGFNDNIGFRFGTCYPWNLYDLKAAEQLPIIEIPLIIQDVAMLSPQKGLRLNWEMAFNYIVLLAERVKDVGGVLTLLWHPNQITNSEYVKIYKKTLKYLEDQNCWMTTVVEIGDWWTGKNNV